MKCKDLDVAEEDLKTSKIRGLTLKHCGLILNAVVQFSNARVQVFRRRGKSFPTSWFHSVERVSVIKAGCKSEFAHEIIASDQLFTPGIHNS